MAEKNQLLKKTKKTKQQQQQQQRKAEENKVKEKEMWEHLSKLNGEFKDIKKAKKE